MSSWHKQIIQSVKRSGFLLAYKRETKLNIDVAVIIVNFDHR